MTTTTAFKSKCCTLCDQFQRGTGVAAWEFLVCDRCLTAFRRIEFVDCPTCAPLDPSAGLVAKMNDTFAELVSAYRARWSVSVAPAAKYPQEFTAPPADLMGEPYQKLRRVDA